MRSVLDFALLEHKFNGHISFLSFPPELGPEKRKMESSRTIFQFEVSPDLALDICHAAIFLEIPSLLEITCRMLGHFFDCIPSLEGVQSIALFHILSHVAPLKLALLEQQPAFERFFNDLTSVWDRHRASLRLSGDEFFVPFSWQRFPEFAEKPIEYSSREAFIQNALRIELGTLSTQYKLDEAIHQAVADSKPSSTSQNGSEGPTITKRWARNDLGEWEREIVVNEPASSQAGSSSSSSSSSSSYWVLIHPKLQDGVGIPSDWKSEAKNSSNSPSAPVRPLVELSSLKPHIRTVILDFPLQFQLLAQLSHLETLKICDRGLWRKLPLALAELTGLRNLVIDNISMQSTTKLAEATYNSFNDMRNEFLVPPNWTPADSIGDGSLSSIDGSSEQEAVFALLRSIQVASALPSLETLQISNLTLDLVSSVSSPVWDIVIAPHMRRTGKPFFPALKKLSLAHSRITPRTLSSILFFFSESPIEMLDLSGFSSSLVDPTIDWEPFTAWKSLRRLILDSRATWAAVPASHSVVGACIPLQVEHLVLEGRQDILTFMIGLNSVPRRIRTLIVKSNITDALSAIVTSDQLQESLEILDLSAEPLKSDSANTICRVAISCPNLKIFRMQSSGFQSHVLAQIISFFETEECASIQLQWLEGPILPRRA